MKIYEVTFNQYTNCMNDTVSDAGKTGQTNYINVGKQPFLITEDQIDEIRKFGNGIKNLKFVGNLWNKPN